MNASSIPSELAPFIEGADYVDIKHIEADTSMRAFIAGMLSYYPWWVVLLYRVRQLLVHLLGLVKHDKPGVPPRLRPEEVSFVPGDRATFFIVRKAEEEKFWVSETPQDKHLTAYFGVVAGNAGTGGRRFTVFTAVRYLHWSGPVYFNLIRPFHHLVVWRMMSAASCNKKPGGKKLIAEADPGYTLLHRFSLKERMVMRTGWAVFTAIGAYGIYVQSPMWAAIYLVLTTAGFVLVALPMLCAHCPYPYKHDTCLFMPPGLMRRFYPYKGPDMGSGEKVGVLATMAGMVGMPNFWLVNRPLLLIFFWLVALPVLAAFPRHYCRRCRHFGCPLNKADQ